MIVDTTDNYLAALMLYDFALTHNQGCESVVTPVIRFKVNGAAPGAMTQRYFVCEGCRSLNFAKLDLNPTGHDQLAVSMVAIRNIPKALATPAPIRSTCSRAPAMLTMLSGVTFRGSSA